MPSLPTLLPVEIDAPGIVLAARPYSEHDAIVALFTEDHGAIRGLARGGLSRTKASLWQPGNLVQSRWAARLSDQLGTISAELVHAGAALAMDDPWALAILSAACAVAEGAIPEREPHPRIFRGMLHLIAHASTGIALLPDLIRWELGLLQDLGFGLDLATCAVTGTKQNLTYVSPRTGRAVSHDAAGLWKERLLPLPHFLATDAPGDPAQWADGLRLTERFLARDAFGLRHLAIPAARLRLAEKLTLLAAAPASPPPESAPAAQTDRSAPERR